MHKNIIRNEMWGWDIEKPDE